VADVLAALDQVTAGRCLKSPADVFGPGHPFVVTKTSNIPGKAVTETPGLVCGDPAWPVTRLAVAMTLTESQLELAGGVGVQAIVCHHPVADAASSGGVPLRGYANLYGVAIFEAHEAFHGRHPGIGLLHGHRPFRVEIAYAGLPGNVMFVGRALPEVKTAADIIARLGAFADLEGETRCLEAERQARCCPELEETSVAVRARLLLGRPDAPVSTILHIFPHTGFTPDHLSRAKAEHPEIDTVIVSISRVREGHPLVQRAGELGLTVLAGNSHALEILENGLPLALALQDLLPGLEVVLFRERVTCQPLAKVGGPAIRDYARQMVDGYLLKKA
jgi:hypothetical protein